MEEAGLAETIVAAVQAVHPHVHALLYSNILLTGAPTVLAYLAFLLSLLLPFAMPRTVGWGILCCPPTWQPPLSHARSLDGLSKLAAFVWRDDAGNQCQCSKPWQLPCD